MKKTILFLINGFGIEQKDSYNVYKSELMPNLDKLTKEALFSSIETSDYNLMDAYRTFSIESNESITYSFLDVYSSRLNENPNFNNYVAGIKADSKIHLFCFLENIKNIDHLKNMIALIKKPVILHIILSSENIDDYKEIDRLISKITLEVKECKIGSIVGKNIMFDLPRDYISMLRNGVGEKWHEIGKKLNALENSKTTPLNTKGFYVNDDFTISSNDTIFILNYEHIDATNFVNELKAIYTGSIYSMFPMEAINYPLYKYPRSSISLVNNLKSIDSKCLVITENDKINYINYFSNGLANLNDPSLLFMKSDGDILYNKEIMDKVLKDDKFNLIIINHTIDDCKTLLELNDKLKKIDLSIGLVNNICLENKFTFILSSLFGIKKELLEDQYIKKMVNFSTKVPIIISDEVYKKKNYSIDYGNIIGLKNTCLKLINTNYKGSGLIKKKGFLSKLINK